MEQDQPEATRKKLVCSKKTGGPQLFAEEREAHGIHNVEYKWILSVAVI